MDLVVACGAIGAVLGVAVGAAAGFARDQKTKTRHILAKYTNALNDRGMCERLLHLHAFAECNQAMYDKICEACDRLSHIHQLAMQSSVNPAVKYEYIWRFHASQYRKVIHSALEKLGQDVYAWNATQLARRSRGGYYNSSATDNVKPKSDFAQCADNLCVLIEDYINNLLLQQ